MAVKNADLSSLHACLFFPCFDNNNDTNNNDNTNKTTIIITKIVEIKRVLEEVRIQGSIFHPNVVSLFGFYFDNQNMSILMEFCSLGRLFVIIYYFIKKKYQNIYIFIYLFK